MGDSLLKACGVCALHEKRGKKDFCKTGKCFTQPQYVCKRFFRDLDKVYKQEGA